MVKNKIKINIFLKLLLKRLPRRRVQALDSRENTDSPMGFFFFFFGWLTTSDSSTATFKTRRQEI